MNKIILMILCFCRIYTMRSDVGQQLSQDQSSQTPLFQDNLNQLTQQQSEFMDQLESIIFRCVKIDDNDAKIISDQVIIWTKEGIVKPQVIALLEKANYDKMIQTFVCDFPNDDSKKFKIDVKNNKVSVMRIDDQVELKVLCSGKFNQKDFIENKGLIRKVLDQLELEVQRYDGLIKFIALVVTIIGGIITIYKVFIS